MSLGLEAIAVEEFFMILLAILAVSVALLGPVVALVFIIILMRRTGRLRRRVDELERAVGTPTTSAGGGLAPPTAEPTPAFEVCAAAAPAGSRRRPKPPINWELLIGRKALGWAAVVVLLFAVAFFLRYAYDNQWIGPLGKVAVGLLLGVTLILGGWRYHDRQWRVFSQMLSTAGVLALFLAVYSAFGFYRLVPQQIASIFLVLVVVESALLAVVYNAPALAWMSLFGGLLTPILLASDRDQYQALFLYITALSVGMAVLAGWRHWVGLATVSLLGTHGLFWMWFARNYHPEKLAWALGFQAAIFALFVAHGLIAHVFRARRARWDDLVRMLLNASLGFAAAYVLLRDDYRPWMGLPAVGMAAAYTALARVVLWRRPEDGRQLLTALAAAVGFIALAFPIQARAEWVALGWAAEAAALSWFGLRVRAPALRAMAAGVMGLAAFRLLAIDTPLRRLDLHLPVVNAYALPALGLVVLWLGSVAAARRWQERLGRVERGFVALAGIAGLLVLWLVLSIDTLDYFRARAQDEPELAVRWRWFGHMTLSGLWAAYGVVLLAIGFARRVPPLRWTALLVFGLTVGKVFLFDMAGLKEFYRVVAFFVVAVLLGLAGWAYQRIRVDRPGVETTSNDPN